MLCRVLFTIILVSWLCHVACGKKKLYSIKDCNQVQLGLVDCRNQGWQSIPYDVFDFPWGKNAIKLGGNPFVCDCRLAWFYEEPPFKDLNEKIIKDVRKDLRCGSPARFKGRLISDLKETDICPQKYFSYNNAGCKKDRRRDLLNCDYIKRKFPYDIFGSKMKKISLKNFQYNCDCKLVWFLRKLKQKKFRSKLYKPSNIGKCVSPKRLVNKRVQDITEEHVCPQLPRKAVDQCKSTPSVCDAMSRCKKDKYTFKCEDIDECAEGKDVCDRKTTKCINKSPSYRCECKPGFASTSLGYRCKDINECSKKDRCAKNAKCINLPGSYQCKCNAGFIGEGKVCFDVNECMLKSTCSNDAKCDNIIGSYRCTCNSGFRGNGTRCTDIDECKNSSTCSTNAECTNSPGSYLCQCKEGYTGNGKICTDINECSSNQHTCHRLAKCRNTIPGYQCLCKPGYKSFDDGRLCEDVDECQRKTYCARQARCENTPGSFQCFCKTGFSGSGKYCEDIDECENSEQCSPHAKCQNFDGSYKCTCNLGYYGNGKICKDIDECWEEEDVCLLANSKCVNTLGSYQCTCMQGYSRNETHCADIDECWSDESPHDCNSKSNEYCINFPGGYKCQCKEGYERFLETEPCVKEEVNSPFYERIYVRIAALAVAAFLVLLTTICCCCCCCKRSGGKKKSTSKKTDEVREPLLYGTEMPFIPMDMPPIPPNISMVSTYSEKQDFDYYDIE